MSLIFNIVLKVFCTGCHEKIGTYSEYTLWMFKQRVFGKYGAHKNAEHFCPNLSGILCILVWIGSDFVEHLRLYNRDIFICLKWQWSAIMPAVKFFLIFTKSFLSKYFHAFYKAFSWHATQKSTASMPKFGHIRNLRTFTCVTQCHWIHVNFKAPSLYKAEFGPPDLELKMDCRKSKSIS